MNTKLSVFVPIMTGLEAEQEGRGFVGRRGMLRPYKRGGPSPCQARVSIVTDAMARPSSARAWAAVAATAIGTTIAIWWRRRRKKPPQLAYGTAGFRADARLLDVAMERVGMVAGIRSRMLSGVATGVMVTASHNPVGDNGCKIIDGDGGMLAVEWEHKAEEVARCAESELAAALAQLGTPAVKRGVVMVGRDTRPHSVRLTKLVKRGIRRVGCVVIDEGEVTTPRLHYGVAAHNAGTWIDYAEGLASNFRRQGEVCDLWVDCAGGVGALAVAELQRHKLQGLSLRAMNRPGEAELNENCGAEFVQKARLPPLGFDDVTFKGRRACSLDGDADRVVYFYWRRDGSFRVLDGDKIAALFAGFIGDELEAAGLARYELGVVQTAYANGASTTYLRQQRCRVVLAKTGVKHLHHKARQFDVGIYFEANGHGTVLFNNATLLAALPERLQRFAALANQSVGDALADLLLVETILGARDWSLEDWDGLYAELPSRQLKVKVRDRRQVVPNELETRLLLPEQLQASIDSYVSTFPQGRAFVRPSGTEDVVRIYAEAATREAADELADKCRRAVLACDSS